MGGPAHPPMAWVRDWHRTARLFNQPGDILNSLETASAKLADVPNGRSYPGGSENINVVGEYAILDQENSREATDASRCNFFVLVTENFGDLLLFVGNTLLLVIGQDSEHLLS